MKFIYCLNSNWRLLYVFNRFICLICTEIGPSVYPPIVFLCFLLINRNKTITIPVFNVEWACSLMSHGCVVFVFPLSFIECCCNKSGLNQSEDQRIQHDEVWGLHIALYGSAIVHNHPVSFACLSVLYFINMGIFFTVRPAAGLNPPQKPPVSPSASSKPSLEVKPTAGSIALILPKLERSGGHWKVKMFSFNPAGGFSNPHTSHMCVYSIRWLQSTSGQNCLENWHCRDHEEALWKENSSWGHVWSAAWRLSTCADKQGQSNLFSPFKK